MTDVSGVNNQLSDIMLNSSQQQVSGGDSDDWYIAFAKAWGKTADGQAQKVIDLSKQIDAGDDSLSTMTMLTAESHKLGFTATAGASALNAAGNGINTVARKQ